MSLSRALSTISKHEQPQLNNSLYTVEVDYYFMASKFAGSNEIVSIWLWTILIDVEGNVYAKKTTHIGDFTQWKDMISNRICDHLKAVGVDNLIAKRMIRDIEIIKDGHLIKTDTRCQGDRIGIDGSDSIHIRRNRFSYKPNN